MSRWKRGVRWAAAGLLALGSAVAGVYAAATLGPEHLRREVERQVQAATGSPCRVGALRVEAGLPVELELRDVTLWDGALHLESARARVSLTAALVGEVRLARLELTGLSVALDSDTGRPPWPWNRPGPAGADVSGDPGDLAHRLEEGLGAVLGAPLLADALRLHGGRIEVRWREGGVPVAFALEDLHGELTHRRLRGERTLVLQARIQAAGAHRGLLEGEASRTGDGPLRATVTATDLDLAWLAATAVVGPARRSELPRGWLSGIADLEVDAAREAALDLDLVARDFAWSAAGAGARPLLAAERVTLRARVEQLPDRIAVAGARVRSGPLDLTIDADLARPARSDSPLGLRVRLAELAVEDLRDLLTAMRASWLEDTRVVLEALDGGRVVALSADARGSLRDWRDDASDDGRGLPSGLRLGARLEDLRIRLGEHDAIERIAIDASWSGDRLVLRDVRGERGGLALPRLDLELDGVSHLLASNLEERVPASDAVRLAGLPLFLSLFEPGSDARAAPPHVEARVERLEHPALLWPMRSVELGLDGHEGVLRGEIRRATWADVPLRGTVEWRGDAKHLIARLQAGASLAPAQPIAFPLPEAGEATEPAPELRGEVWAVGQLAIGPLHSRVWAHERAVGRFRAAGSAVAFDGVEAWLSPSGQIRGSGTLDLSRVEALPYSARFAARELDADALFTRAGLGAGLASARVDLAGELSSRYERELHPFAALSGSIDVVARAGRIRQDLPAVLALALAGEGLNLLRNSEYVRFQECAARFSLDDGVARTDAFRFDGPDVRAYGAGSLDLGHPPHPVEAEVVVFLFRPVDRVLGAVPVLGDLILGGSDNLFAAYFRLDGPWDAPTATAQPLRSLNAGPLRLVTGLPGIVRRGLETLGGAFPAPDGDLAPPAAPGRAQP